MLTAHCSPRYNRQELSWELLRSLVFWGSAFRQSAAPIGCLSLGIEHLSRWGAFTHVIGTPDCDCFCSENHCPSIILTRGLLFHLVCLEHLQHIFTTVVAQLTPFKFRDTFLRGSSPFLPASRSSRVDSQPVCNCGDMSDKRPITRTGTWPDGQGWNMPLVLGPCHLDQAVLPRQNHRYIHTLCRCFASRPHTASV